MFQYIVPTFLLFLAIYFYARKNMKLSKSKHCGTLIFDAVDKIINDYDKNTNFVFSEEFETYKISLLIYIHFIELILKKGKGTTKDITPEDFEIKILEIYFESFDKMNALTIKKLKNDNPEWKNSVLEILESQHVPEPDEIVKIIKEEFRKGYNSNIKLIKMEILDLFYIKNE